MIIGVHAVVIMNIVLNKYQLVRLAVRIPSVATKIFIADFSMDNGVSTNPNWGGVLMHP